MGKRKQQNQEKNLHVCYTKKSTVQEADHGVDFSFMSRRRHLNFNWNNELQ